MKFKLEDYVATVKFFALLIALKTLMALGELKVMRDEAPETL
ncbi:MAG: hypothetical protein QXS32_09070 [Candidatus Nezhaarchaeales archaeon]